MADVKILRGTQANYDELGEKDPDAIYICLDTGRTYRGETLLTDGIQSDWEQFDNEKGSYIRNKPDLSVYEITWETI